MNGHFGTGAPQSRSSLFRLFPGPLELAAIGVSEGRCACKTKLYEVLVEEVFVDSVSVGVEVNLRESPSVGVF